VVEEYGGREGGRGWYIRGRKGGIKYALSVKFTLFWDFLMHTVLFKDCMLFSRVVTTSGRMDNIRLTSAT